MASEHEGFCQVKISLYKNGDLQMPRSPKKKQSLKKEPLLAIELIPRSCWGQNLRNIISKENWRQLRILYGAYSGKCTICGNGDYESSLHLHEVWNYDDICEVQKLIGFQAICEDCHDVKHFGRSWKVGLGEAALLHLKKVNNWDDKTTLQYVKEVMAIWEARSMRRYKLDVSIIDEIDEICFPDGKPKLHWDWLEDRSHHRNDKFDSMRWAAAALDSKALILDTETTGLLTSRQSEIIQIAVIDIKGKPIFDQLIRPRKTIPKRTIEINGITNELVENCPSFDEIYPEISEMLSSRTIISYNAKFDQGILAQTCKLYGLPLIDCRWECAMHRYTDYADSEIFLRLPNSSHRARDDCYATLELIKKMSIGERI